MSKSKPNSKVIFASNRKAFFNYEIVDKLECGIVLLGSEVKSIRQKHITIRDAYVRIFNEELFLVGCHITPFSQAQAFPVPPVRDRKLLIHRQQLDRWNKKVQEKGMTLVPLEVYLSKNHIKLLVGLGKSKKMVDKRRSIKNKDIQRELDRGQKLRR